MKKLGFSPNIMQGFVYLFILKSDRSGFIRIKDKYRKDKITFP